MGLAAGVEVRKWSGLPVPSFFLVLALAHVAGPQGSAQEVGEVFQDCEACPMMVVVPAGTFLMGSPDSETEASVGGADAEKPQHAVTIGAPFAIGLYEVAFAEWDACVRAGGCDGYLPADEGWGRGLASGHQRELAPGAGLRCVAVRRNRRAVPASQRGRVGVRGPRGHEHEALLGRRSHGAVSPRQRL